MRQGLLVWLMFVSVLLFQKVARTDEGFDFARDVRLVLADNCLGCHGQDPAARKAGLRLDVREEALKGGKSGKAAIVPGRSSLSELVARVTTTDPSKRMPPDDSKKTLTPGEIETLRRWIDAGASYPRHWAFVPPSRPSLPGVKQADWVRNEIDLFVLARLEKEGLKPSPEADRATLLRRLALDLTGLPPSPAELDQFLADTSTEAFPKQLERLLQSPRYGEKWARHWLDAARYADSDGYEKDLPRKQWPWRDYVIKAFNCDLPYDQFVIEQIAGDLLPNATQDQLVATGFLRNSMVSEEGAILAEQYRMEAMFDRMDCVGKSILGLTIQCAQCHSHKFDPLSQSEYYGFFSFLNNANEATSHVYSASEHEKIQRIRHDVAELERGLKQANPGWEHELAKWEEKVKQQEVTTWEVLDPLDYGVERGVVHSDKLPDGSIITLGFRPTREDLYAIARTKLSGIHGVRLEALTHGDLTFGGPGRSYKGAFALSELTVEAASLDSPKNFVKVPLLGTTADFAEPERLLEEFFRKGEDDKRVVGPAAFLTDGKEETAWSADRGPGRRHQNSHAVVELGAYDWPAEGSLLRITVKFRHGGADTHGTQNNFLGRMRFSVSTTPHPRADPISEPLRKAIRTPKEKRTPAEQAAIFSFWRTTVADWKLANEAIGALWRQHPEGESVLNLTERAPEHTRETFLLTRGDWQKPEKKISPETPAFLHKFPDDSPRTRLGLARWLVDRRSPTTARVIVNRIWQSYFGTALVETPEDFGVRAAEPFNPELLDWLAVEFMERGWQFKALHRLISSSATYRQSSRVTQNLFERDPRNRLLARGPRFRAEAEVVRDITLHASGLLTEKLGGPSVFPPVPDNLFAISFIPVTFWKVATDGDRYRRAIYTFRRRSIPDPALSSFDAPNGDLACVRRVRSNTPLAALASLNETVFVEAAQALALRSLREGGSSDPERAVYAFRLCTSRNPRPGEIEEILKLLRSQTERIVQGWLTAKEIAFPNPERRADLPAAVTPTQVAAWTIVARVLLNLDETITKS